MEVHLRAPDRDRRVHGPSRAGHRQLGDGHRTPPVGDPVTDDAADDVAAFNPAVAIVKQVNGADAATITPGGAANYTYDVTNTGNTPLQNVTVEDTTAAPSPPACSPLVRGADGPRQQQ